MFQSILLPLRERGKLGYIYYYIQPHYYHLNGWRSQIYATHVWGKSITDKNTFYTIENETKYFKRINKMGNLAIRGQLGLARNIDSPFPPFVIDNNRNLRGAGNLVQRGNAYWSINTEYRHTLLEKGVVHLTRKHLYRYGWKTTR